ncbi:hypothetical protein FACS1894145_2200 [Bacteroidia bacterium]|nr:hypothetical protein FACS1894145_2200 [Bacteroidia bacterium]
MKQDIIPDILNSRNERVILELPNYSYCHSSQTQDESHSLFFLGRQSLLRKLKNLLSTAASKTGVYLVTGNRGVGKSRLVEELIKETSLQKHSFANYISFLFVALFLTLGLQYVTNQESIKNFIELRKLWITIILGISSVILLFVIGHYSYLRTTTRQYEKNFKGFGEHGINWSGIWHSSKAILKDFLMIPSKTNPFLRTQNVLKLILLLLLIQISATITCFTHFQLFIIYLSAVFGYYYVKYAKQILIQEYRESYNSKSKDWKYKDKEVSLANALKKRLQWITFAVVIVSIVGTGLSIKWHCLGWFQGCGFGLSNWWVPLIGSIAIILVAVFVMHCYVIRLTLIKGEKIKALKFTWQYSYPQLTSLLNKINHYIRNSSRVYLKINFGHDVLNERDMLRLITRTLTSEYTNFRKSWTHTFYWRALALAILLSATHLFYKNIYKNDILPLVKANNWNTSNSQKYYLSSYDDKRENDSTFLSNYLDTKEYIDYYKNSLVQVDKAINRIYCFILNVKDYFWAKDEEEIIKIKNNYNHAPINYAWWIIFFTFYLLGCLLLRLKFFTTHYTIKRQLKQLNENITYSTEREISARIGDVPQHKPYFSIRKKQTRIIADAREIEKELQDILGNIQKIPSFMARPEFVIVFDELDKVSPETQTPTQESETKHKETLFASNSTSERQAIILKLLSNMKYFLSTANAKFIFIAGREMYDMYLADIADRNNYFGSIFNDVIFVPSFLTDVKNNKKQYDITTLVEEYVCRHLIPEDYPNIEYNLKEYNKYLDDLIYFDSKLERKKIEELDKRIEEAAKIPLDDYFMQNYHISPNEYKKQRDAIKSIIDKYEPQVNMKKQKIIATLQQFIIYLAHTSKGAPKKMVQVFESFIASYENEPLGNRYLVVKQFKNTKLYLNLDYYAQYTIGMTSYLMTPVFNRLSDANIQEHSDKLLVSTLHFVDYMMKFHNQNFSWRSIDISPELIEINHSPELKAIVNDIVTLFEQIHFNKPVISLYEFKFDALLAQEIFFLSKMDERFSAQFNFSLDESLILKEYYKKLLKEKQEEYGKYKTYGKDYVSSIASLQIVLGDLHFLDDELDVAALYYKDGLFLLQKQLDKDKEKENLEIFYLFIRNQLKLAYLYEKRKQADFAYLLYGELTTLLIKYRNFDLKDIGISIREDGEDDFIMVKREIQESNYHKYIEIIPYCSNLDTPIYDDIDDAKIRPMQFKQLSPKTQQVMFKNMTFEGLQLIYLPLLAKLQILEKRSLVGILKKDIKLLEQEFEFLTRTISHSEIKIIAADFYSKIGDILFYKNKVFSSSADEKPKLNTDNKKIDISHYACLYYKKAFIALTVKAGKEEENEKKIFERKTILKILQDENFKKAEYIDSKVSTRYRAMMARVLSNLGDVYFQAKEEQCRSCDFKNPTCDNIPFIIATSKAKSETNIFWKKWECFINSKEEEYTLSEFINDIFREKSNMQLSNIELALFLYSISMKYYRKANQNKHYAFQVEKILNCLKYCLRYNIHSDKIKEFLRWNKKDKKYENLENLTSKAIRSLYLAYDNLNTLEINKRKEDFDKFNETFDKRDIPLHYIQIDSEVSRIRTIFKELELELAKINNTEVYTVKKLYTNYITSPYHTNYSVSARVHRLRVKDHLNREAYDIMKQDIFKYTCSDSIDCRLSCSCEKCEYSDYAVCNNNLYCQIMEMLIRNKWEGTTTKKIFNEQIIGLDNKVNKFFAVLEMLIADSIFCLDEILRLIKTAGDSYLFNHSFFAEVYNRLAVWTSRYEALKIIKDYYNDNNIDENILPEKFKAVITHFPKVSYKQPIKQVLEKMQIDNYLQKFLGNDFKEQLSSHYYREQAVAHYYQTLDTHNGGRAYLNMLEQMYFIKGDYDDVSSHFNVALERFLVNNSDEFQKRMKELTAKGKNSTVYDVNNYFELPKHF